MEWAKILRLTSTARELAGLLPEDCPSRMAIEGGRLYWEEILAIVEVELAQQESWGEHDGLYWALLNELRNPLVELTQIWQALTHPETALMPLTEQGLFVRVFNLRRKRTFEVAN
jgi:hypothetical protein